MAFTTKQIARAIHLGEATIRQWLSRAPHFEIGTIVGAARLYTEKEAMTIMVASELMRHGLARPYEALPAARAAAHGRGVLWAYRDNNDELAITPDRPAAAVAVMIPMDLLHSRLTNRK